MTARTVRWSKSAQLDFRAAVSRVHEDNPIAAARLAETIGEAVEALAKRNTGRRGRVNGTFEKSFPKWRYIVAFEVRGVSGAQEEIFVLRVIHTSRDWPKGAWPK